MNTIILSILMLLIGVFLCVANVYIEQSFNSDVAEDNIVVKLNKGILVIGVVFITAALISLYYEIQCRATPCLQNEIGNLIYEVFFLLLGLALLSISIIMLKESTSDVADDSINAWLYSIMGAGATFTLVCAFLLYKKLKSPKAAASSGSGSSGKSEGKSESKSEGKSAKSEFRRKHIKRY